MRTFKEVLAEKLEQQNDPCLEEIDEILYQQAIEKLKLEFPKWGDREIEFWAGIFTMANVDDFDLKPEGQYEDDDTEIPLFSAQFIYCYGS
jgi:hypothetical protein